MRTILITLVVLLSSLMIFSSRAAAVNVFPVCNSGAATTSDVCHAVTNQNNSGADPILRVLKIVIDVISFIIGIASVIVLIIAGLQIITGGSDPQAIETARNSIIYALVGIAVAVLAQVIVVFVLKHVA